MKKGAGDDPFADDDNENQDVGPKSQDLPQSDREGANNGGRNEDAAEEGQPAEPGESVVATATNDKSAVVESTPDDDSKPTLSTETSTTMTTSASQSVNALPYLAKRQLRGESVKSDRHQVPFFLREEVQRGEKTLQRAVEDGFEQDVSKTDLREAAYVFAQKHPEGVAAILREWGIEYLE